MQSPPPQNDRLVHLDMLRGIAALLVCVGHLRGFLLAPHSSIEFPTLLQTALYGVTSLGHQSVIIFFALSGYLVGGQALRQIVSDTWNPGGYMLRRMTRLWVVALPAIFLTWFWDSIGHNTYLPEMYNGALFELIASGPSPSSPVEHGLTTLLGNVFFLQTVAVPVFGNNGPMWSLANEFWYYIIFPFALHAVIGTKTLAYRFVLVLLVSVIIYALPKPLLALGIVWIFGALTAHYGSVLERFSITVRAVIASICVMAFLTFLGFSLVNAGLGMDLLLGSTCALILPILAQAPGLGTLYKRVASALSEISYTLYVVHFPFLTALILWVEFPLKSDPSASAIASLLGCLLLTLLYAWIVWWCFERNTTQIRIWLENSLGRRSVPVIKDVSRP